MLLLLGQSHPAIVLTDLPPRIQLPVAERHQARVRRSIETCSLPSRPLREQC
jgi:hypothetical protein